MRKERVDLIPCEFCEGFFVVPGNNRFSVSRDGIVFDRLEKQIAINSLPDSNADRGPKTYLSVYDFPVHRLVAETFLEKDHLPKDVILVVNHLNGIIVDNRVENLEWTTYQGNSIHAFQNGLRSDNIPVLCKNFETQEVRRFYSYWDCARKLGTNGANVYHYLNRVNKNKLFLNRYLLIKEGDDWPELDFDEVLRNQKRDLFLMDRLANSAAIFETVNDLAEYCQVSYGLIYKKLKQMRVDKVKSFDISGFTVMYLDDVSDWLRQSAVRKNTVRSNNRGVRKPKRVSVKNLESNETKEYESLEEFCKILGERKNTVQKHILMNDGIWHGLFKITYL